MFFKLVTTSSCSMLAVLTVLLFGLFQEPVGAIHFRQRHVRSKDARIEHLTRTLLDAVPDEVGDESWKEVQTMATHAIQSLDGEELVSLATSLVELAESQGSPFGCMDARTRIVQSSIGLNQTHSFAAPPSPPSPSPTKDCPALARLAHPALKSIFDEANLAREWKILNGTDAVEWCEGIDGVEASSVVHVKPKPLNPSLNIDASGKFYYKILNADFNVDANVKCRAVKMRKDSLTEEERAILPVRNQDPIADPIARRCRSRNPREVHIPRYTVVRNLALQDGDKGRRCLFIHGKFGLSKEYFKTNNENDFSPKQSMVAQTVGCEEVWIFQYPTLEVEGGWKNEWLQAAFVEMIRIFDYDPCHPDKTKIFAMGFANMVLAGAIQNGRFKDLATGSCMFGAGPKWTNGAKCEDCTCRGPSWYMSEAPLMGSYLVEGASQACTGSFGGLAKFLTKQCDLSQPGALKLTGERAITEGLPLSYVGRFYSSEADLSLDPAQPILKSGDLAHTAYEYAAGSMCSTKPTGIQDAWPAHFHELKSTIGPDGPTGKGGDKIVGDGFYESESCIGGILTFKKKWGNDLRSASNYYTPAINYQDAMCEAADAITCDPTSVGDKSKCPLLWYTLMSRESQEKDSGCGREIQKPEVKEAEKKLAAAQLVNTATLKVNADDKFTVLQDGKVLGGGTDWHTTEQYTIILPEARSTVIAIQADITPGRVGGIIASLEPTDGRRPAIVTDRSWKCSSKREQEWDSEYFDDSKWIRAEEIFDNGDGVWGSQYTQAQKANAKWIWPSGGQSDSAYCRIVIKSGQGCDMICGNGGKPNAACNACECPKPWGGKHCSKCANSCRNGGEPRPDLDCICDCPGGWLGANCDQCNLQCAHNALPDTSCLSCDCRPPWVGSTCTECGLPCENGATPDDICSKCLCPPNRLGRYCDICSISCLNGGQPNAMCNGCVCKGPWTGDRCGVFSAMASAGGSGVATPPFTGGLGVSSPQILRRETNGQFGSSPLTSASTVPTVSAPEAARVAASSDGGQVPPSLGDQVMGSTPNAALGDASRAPKTPPGVVGGQGAAGLPGQGSARLLGAQRGASAELLPGQGSATNRLGGQGPSGTLGSLSAGGASVMPGQGSAGMTMNVKQPQVPKGAASLPKPVAETAFNKPLVGEMRLPQDTPFSAASPQTPTAPLPVPDASADFEEVWFSQPLTRFKWEEATDIPNMIGSPLAPTQCDSTPHDPSSTLILSHPDKLEQIILGPTLGASQKLASQDIRFTTKSTKPGRFALHTMDKYELTDGKFSVTMKIMDAADGNYPGLRNGGGIFDVWLYSSYYLYVHVYAELVDGVRKWSIESSSGKKIFLTDGFEYGHIYRISVTAGGDESIVRISELSLNCQNEVEATTRLELNLGFQLATLCPFRVIVGTFVTPHEVASECGCCGTYQDSKILKMSMRNVKVLKRHVEDEDEDDSQQ